MARKSRTRFLFQTARQDTDAKFDVLYSLKQSASSTLRRRYLQPLLASVREKLAPISDVCYSKKG